MHSCFRGDISQLGWKFYCFLSHFNLRILSFLKGRVQTRIFYPEPLGLLWSPLRPPKVRVSRSFQESPPTRRQNVWQNRNALADLALAFTRPCHATSMPFSLAPTQSPKVHVFGSAVLTVFMCTAIKLRLISKFSIFTINIYKSVRIMKPCR